MKSCKFRWKRRRPTYDWQPPRRGRYAELAIAVSKRSPDPATYITKLPRGCSLQDALSDFARSEWNRQTLKTTATLYVDGEIAAESAVTFRVRETRGRAQ